MRNYALPTSSRTSTPPASRSTRLATGRGAFLSHPADDTKALYHRYAALAERKKHISFIGPPGNYRYYNMGRVTGLALAEADKLAAKYVAAGDRCISRFRHGLSFNRLLES